MFIAIDNTNAQAILRRDEYEKHGSLIAAVPYGNPSRKVGGICSVLLFFFSDLPRRKKSCLSLPC